MSVLPRRMFVHHVSAWCPRKSEGGIELTGNAVRDDCAPHVVLGNRFQQEPEVQGIWRVDVSVWDLGCRLGWERSEKWMEKRWEREKARRHSGFYPVEPLGTDTSGGSMEGEGLFAFGGVGVSLWDQVGYGHSLLDEQIWSSGCRLLGSGHALCWY